MLCPGVVHRADQDSCHSARMQLAANHFPYGAVPSARSVAAGFIISAFSAFWLILALGVDKHDDNDRGRRDTVGFPFDPAKWIVAAAADPLHHWGTSHSNILARCCLAREPDQSCACCFASGDDADLPAVHLLHLLLLACIRLHDYIAAAQHQCDLHALNLAAAKSDAVSMLKSYVAADWRTVTVVNPAAGRRVDGAGRRRRAEGRYAGYRRGRHDRRPRRRRCCHRVKACQSGI